MPNGLSTLQRAFLPPAVLLAPPATHDTTAAVAHAPVPVATAFGLSSQEAAVTQRDAMTRSPCQMTANSLCSGVQLDGINAVQRGLSIQPAWEGSGQSFLSACSRQPMCGHAYAPVSTACPSSALSMQGAQFSSLVPGTMVPPPASW